VNQKGFNLPGMSEEGGEIEDLEWRNAKTNEAKNED
jgi:hypothetical protein